MTVVWQDTAQATRSLPIQPWLLEVLRQAGVAARVDLVRVTSGGQPAFPAGPRVGSTRHDLGHAADLELHVGGAAVAFSNASAPKQWVAFIESCAALGAIGIGAGTDYMGPLRAHIGGGAEGQRGTRVVFGGPGGRAADAPAWLSAAAGRGWAFRDAGASGSIPVVGEVSSGAQAVSVLAPQAVTHAVTAASGLRLRALPGTHGSVMALVPDATGVQVMEQWARVALPDGRMGWMSLAHLRAL